MAMRTISIGCRWSCSGCSSIYFETTSVNCSELALGGAHDLASSDSREALTYPVQYPFNQGLSFFEQAFAKFAVPAAAEAPEIKMINALIAACFFDTIFDLWLF